MGPIHFECITTSMCDGVRCAGRLRSTPTPKRLQLPDHRSHPTRTGFSVQPRTADCATFSAGRLGPPCRSCLATLKAKMSSPGDADIAGAWAYFYIVCAKQNLHISQPRGRRLREGLHRLPRLPRTCRHQLRKIRQARAMRFAPSCLRRLSSCHHLSDRRTISILSTIARLNDFDELKGAAA